MTNRPGRLIRTPNTKRHRFDAIDLRSLVKKRNSVAMPWVDMVEDVRLIREGFATRLPNDRWQINGRVYARESSDAGTMFPESGDGIVAMTREQFRALTILRGYGSDSMAIERRLAEQDSITESDIAFARDVIRQATKP